MTCLPQLLAVEAVMIGVDHNMFGDNVLIKTGIIFFHKIDTAIFQDPDDFRQTLLSGWDVM